MNDQDHHPRPAAARDAADHDASDRGKTLRLFEASRHEPLTIAALRANGVQMPGQAIYELEVDGYPIERVYRRGRDRGCALAGYRLNPSARHLDTSAAPNPADLS